MRTLKKCHAGERSTVLKGARISNPCVGVGVGIRTDWKSVPLSIRHTHDEHETLIFRSPLKYIELMLMKSPNFSKKESFGNLGGNGTLSKYYLSDTGFRKVRLAKGKVADMGHLLENAVYLELRRRYSDVYVDKWNGSEIDFVAVDSDRTLTYYQVVLSAASPEMLERELAPLNAIRDSNPKYLLTTDLDFNPVYNGIRKLNVADWLMAKQGTE